MRMGPAESFPADVTKEPSPCYAKKNEFSFGISLDLDKFLTLKNEN